MTTRKFVCLLFALAVFLAPRQSEAKRLSKRAVFADVPTTAKVMVGPEAGCGIVVYGTKAKILHAIDAKTSKELWKCSFKSPLLHHHPVIANDSVVIVVPNEGLRCYEARTGKERWRNPLRSL